MAIQRKAGGISRTATGGFKRGEGISRAAIKPQSPLDDMEYTGDPEKDSLREAELSLEALQNKERKKALREKIKSTTDSGYWCCLCFESREQKEAFLEGLGISDLGDMYIDGLEVARRLKFELPPSNMEYRSTAKPNKRLMALVKGD